MFGFHWTMTGYHNALIIVDTFKGCNGLWARAGLFLNALGVLPGIGGS
jgi:hypothetical protein